MIANVWMIKYINSTSFHVKNIVACLPTATYKKISLFLVITTYYENESWNYIAHLLNPSLLLDRCIRCNGDPSGSPLFVFMKNRDLWILVSWRQNHLAFYLQTKKLPFNSRLRDWQGMFGNWKFQKKNWNSAEL